MSWFDAHAIDIIFACLIVVLILQIVKIVLT